MPKTKWTLEEMIDLETCLHRYGDDIKGDRLVESNIVAPLLEKYPKLSIKKKKSLAFKAWLEHRLKDYEVRPSDYWSSAYAHVIFIASIFVFLLGVGAVLGLMDWQEKAFNIGILLGVTLVLPWFLFILTAALYLISKGKSHPWFSLLIGFTNKLWEKSEKLEFPWSEHKQSIEKPLKKRLFKSLQMLSLVYSIGCLLGILFAILFLEVTIYWEATPSSNMVHFWYRVSQFLSLPWQWSNFALPTLQDVQAIRFSDFSKTEQNQSVAETWAYFCMLCIFVWSCIPRLFLYLIGCVAYKASLATASFEQARHRQLWRRLCTQSLDSQHEIDDDKAIFIDIGGSGAPLEKIRPFILQKLRLNPMEVYSLGTLNTEQIARVEEQMKTDQSPIIMCCEASEFSPKALLSHIRKMKNDYERRSIFILLLGSANPTPPDEAQLEQWTQWVDQLADPTIDLIAFDEVKSEQHEKSESSLTEKENEDEPSK